MKRSKCLGIVFLACMTSSCAAGGAKSVKVVRKASDAGVSHRGEEDAADASSTPVADAGAPAGMATPEDLTPPDPTPEPDPADSPPPMDPGPPPDYQADPAGPMCTNYVARSDEPWTLELASHFLCDSECAALVGEAYLGDGRFPWSWIAGPIARSEGGDYRFDLHEFTPGIYRVSYIIPSEGCDAALGTAGPGPMCVDGGPWAAYRDGADICEPYRSWVWCGDAPDGTGYTCSLMFGMNGDGTVYPAGNR